MRNSLVARLMEVPMTHHDGHQETATALERIDRDVLVPASPEQVWEVITQDGWLAEQVELALEPGGEARFAGRDGVRPGWVEESVSPAGDGQGRLVFWWGPEGEPATRVELTLAPADAGGTRLRVAETRPLEALDLLGLPLPGQPGANRGPAMLALA
jgi:uncharacterized protein YndB with AHSA1/START domain